MIPNLSSTAKISGLLLLNLLDPSYLKKFFYKPKKNENHYILDKQGRITIYRGINISNSAKSSPDFLPWQTKNDFAKIKTWGFNLVRYMVFWSAIEPTEGSYNTQYVQSTIERLKWLQELNIDVILDVHQDIYNNKFGGDGFPSWTIHNTDSFTQRSPWNMNYFEPAVIDSYNYFWGCAELKSKYINMLQFILSKVDGLDNVIGIDVMNEPFLGTIPRFEKTVLTEFYNNIQDMMNKNNFKAELCFEPEMYTSAGIPSDLRFEPNRDSTYSPHYYDPFVHQGSKYTFLNKMLMKKAIDIKLREAQELNSPLWFGEVGVESSVIGYEQYLKDFTKISTEQLINFCYFSYDKDSMGIIDEKSEPTGQLKAIIGVYAQKIAGKNPVISSTPHSFVLDYEANGLGYTEIFIPSDLKNLSIKVNNMVYPPPTDNIFKTIGNGEEYVAITWTD